MTDTFLRFEFKYPIQSRLLPSIELDLLKAGFKKDEANNSYDGFYYVSSIYFDTPMLKDYHEKAAGLLDRKKVRIRSYSKRPLGQEPDSDKIWLEIKEKHDMMISKKRILVSSQELNQILHSPHSAYRTIGARLSSQERPFFSKFIFLITSESRKPYILIQYKRRAFQYLSGEDRVRITLDYDIRAEKRKLFSSEPSTDVSKGSAIVELKFGKKLPAPVKFLLEKYRLQRDAYSKYTNSVDATRIFYPVYH